MNTRQLLCVGTLALSALTAMAQEATQFPLERGMLTRAEVKAELARALAAGEIVNGNDADWRSNRALAQADTTSVARSRSEVRQEARAAARQGMNTDYVGG